MQELQLPVLIMQVNAGIKDVYQTGIKGIHSAEIEVNVYLSYMEKSYWYMLMHGLKLIKVVYHSGISYLKYEN